MKLNKTIRHLLKNHKREMRAYKHEKLFVGDDVRFINQRKAEMMMWKSHKVRERELVNG